MDKNKVISLCNKVKETIDWKYDYFSGYQDMMNEIYGYIEEIIDETSKE